MSVSVSCSPVYIWTSRNTHFVELLRETGEEPSVLRQIGQKYLGEGALKDRGLSLKDRVVATKIRRSGLSAVVQPRRG
jgi:hypothetical protein